MEEFDRGIFESIIEKVIVCGYDEDGNKDPYKITFIYKTGFKNEIGSAKERFDKSKSMGDKAKELCSHIRDEVKDVCSYVSDNTCGDGCSFVPTKPDDTIEIDLDLDELDATSAKTKATYQEIKDYVLKEFGLKVSNLYISQIKRKCGIEVGENYNLPKTENPKVPQCPKEKEEAIKAALKYFAMI